MPMVKFAALPPRCPPGRVPMANALRSGPILSADRGKRRGASGGAYVKFRAAAPGRFAAFRPLRPNDVQSRNVADNKAVYSFILPVNEPGAAEGVGGSLEWQTARGPDQVPGAREHRLCPQPAVLSSASGPVATLGEGGSCGAHTLLPGRLNGRWRGDDRR